MRGGPGGGTSLDKKREAEHTYCYTPGPMPSGKPLGPRLYEIPSGYHVNRGIKLIVLLGILGMLLYFVLGPLYGEGEAIAVILIAIILLVLVLHTIFVKRHVTVYSDRVVINGRTFRNSDVHWVDIYEIEYVHPSDEREYRRRISGRFGIFWLLTTDVKKSYRVEMVFTVAGPENDMGFLVRDDCTGMEAEAKAVELQRYLPNLQISYV